MSYPLTAIISDLHGNVPALEVALTDARARGARRYVCLGDVVGYGSQPRECLDLVMRLCAESGATDPADGSALEDGICLRGNHEHALLNSAEDFNPKARAAIEWTREELSRGERDKSFAFWDYLDVIQPKACDDRAMFTHGGPREPVREYLLPRDVRDEVKMAGNFAAMERDVCFVGHSHVPAVYYQDGRLFRPDGTDGPYALGANPAMRAIVNVGSVGQPRDGDHRLSYVLFDGESVQFVRLEYDHHKAAEGIRAVSDLPDYLADRLLVGR